MADETADVSNQEQVVICLRWIDDDTLLAHEDFVAMKPVEKCTADVLVRVIKVKCFIKSSFMCLYFS